MTRAVREFLEREIYLRVHTAKVETKKTASRQGKQLPPRLPDRILVFDTETRIDVHQQFMFGIFRIARRLQKSENFLTEREGIFYSGEVEPEPFNYAAELSKQELNAIGAFVSSTIPDVELNLFPPRPKLEVYQTFTAFMDKVFWPCVRRGYMLVLFNAPFDLSRISRGWRPTRHNRGFGLIFKWFLSQKQQKWIPSQFKPRIRIDGKDARTAFIKVGRTARPNQWQNPERICDLGTLLFSLFDEFHKLDSWADEFREMGYKVESKLKHTPSGRVTKEELEYCRQDVKTTQQLFNATIAELLKHPIPSLLPDKSYSPATVGKAYLEEMGIVPPLKKFNIPNEHLGIAMEAYYGGRAEVHIRRKRVPIVRVDFLSQYPTVNALEGNSDILTAERVELRESTQQVRDFLKGLTLEKLFDPPTWKQLNFFARVRPDHDIFPIRAEYKGKDSVNIGLNYLTSQEPIWFAGPDIAASIILNHGKIPRIEKALTIVPLGQQSGMRPVKLMGKVEVDPNTDDFFRFVIEQRKANESNKLLYKGLKIIANATAYGCFVELNEQEQDKQTVIDVYSGDHHHSQKVSVFEEPGKWYFPIIGAQITAGARLLLAMAEASVKELDGTFMMCDTDSLCIVASKDGGQLVGHGGEPLRIDALGEAGPVMTISVITWKQVEQICNRFHSLNPYSFGGSILQIEKINYEPGTKVQRQLYGYAISAKRYALFLGKNASKIVDAKAHGIGYLISPSGSANWTDEFWDAVLHNESIHNRTGEPAWLDHPAMMKVPITSPAVLGRVKNFCKPFDFVLAPVTDKSVRSNLKDDSPILVTRFTTNPEEWLTATYYDCRTGDEVRITTDPRKVRKGVILVNTYRQVLTLYPHNPESKFAGPDGKQSTSETIGHLQRLHVVAKRHLRCGKEFRRKYELGPHVDGSKGSIENPTDATLPIYQSKKVELSNAMKTKILNIGSRELRRNGFSPKTVKAALNGGVQPSTYERFAKVIQDKPRPITR